jgi:hypothetical protein
MISDAMWMIAGVAATTLAFLAIWKLEAATYVYDARPGDVGIEFSLFRIWTIYVLPYSEIESVDVRPGWGGLFAYNFKNRLFSPSFLIKKKRGWFTRQILITPPTGEGLRRALDHARVRVNTRAMSRGSPWVQ